MNARPIFSFLVLLAACALPLLSQAQQPWPNRTVRLGQDGWARAASGSADATTSVKTLSAHFIERDYRTPRASISSRKGSGRKPRSRADHRASRRCHSTPSPMIARPTSESASGKIMLSLNTSYER